MSNGTKKLGKDFQKPEGSPNLRSVTVTFTEKQIAVSYKNANWEMAVDLLIDGLQIARVNEIKARQEKEPSRIVIPSLAGIPPLKES